ncbi:flagellar protein FlhE [Halomonas chromatireducens]|uniref:Flagellar protein FlhE n=1 Tax=Halomonas chromatireducens TaxID=507626 RepID=A0A109UMI8_9GAMM|nr:flagellar protein FlhE [Halomonas chromatireducens]AMD01807.1 Flagellar protein FlhE precursor [Halomonas chromatireducens]
MKLIQQSWAKLLLGLGGTLIASLAQASGSWVASAPAVQVVMSERQVQSADMVPPTAELARNQVMGRVSWQFQTSSGAEVNARLCHAGGCVTLAGPRGHTEAFAGIPADSALYFQFALRERGQRAMTLQGLQVIVNHHEQERAAAGSYDGSRRGSGRCDS